MMRWVKTPKIGIPKNENPWSTFIYSSKWEYRLKMGGKMNGGLYNTSPRNRLFKIFCKEKDICFGCLFTMLNDIFRLYNFWLISFTNRCSMIDIWRYIYTLIAKLIEHKFRLKSSFGKRGNIFFILSSGIVYRFWKGIILYYTTI